MCPFVVKKDDNYGDAAGHLAMHAGRKEVSPQEHYTLVEKKGHLKKELARDVRETLRTVIQSESLNLNSVSKLTVSSSHTIVVQFPGIVAEKANSAFILNSRIIHCSSVVVRRRSCTD